MLLIYSGKLKGDIIVVSLNIHYVNWSDASQDIIKTRG